MKQLNILCGFLMAFADSVPGVSGGTIAYILGLYDKMIDSASTLMSRKKQGNKKEAKTFLLRLGLGWFVGIIISVLLIASFVESRIYDVSSLFIGFIVISIPFVIKTESETLKNNLKSCYFLVIGIVLVVAVAMLNPAGSDTMTSLNIQTYLYIFIAGAIAVSALLLPGISGSTLLLIFGVYFTIIKAINEVLRLNFAQLPLLIVFGMGIIFGIVVSIKVISYAFKKHTGKITYLIIGLMIGSLYAIIKGPTTLDIPLPGLSFETFNPLFFIVGILLIIGLELLKNFMLRNETKKIAKK